MSSGKVTIFMGDGYGKSAAALGIAMKRASEHDRIVIIQFLKGKGITDSEFTKRLEPEIKIFRFEKSEIDYLERTPEEQREAAVNIRNGLSYARKVLATGECNLLKCLKSSTRGSSMWTISRSSWNRAWTQIS